MTDTSTDVMLDELRKVIDELEEAASLKSALEDRKRAIHAQIRHFSESTGLTKFGTDLISVRVEETMKPAYDKDRWPDICEWAHKTGNMHIIQRRLGSRAIQELCDSGVPFPEGLRLEAVTEVKHTRKR